MITSMYSWCLLTEYSFYPVIRLLTTFILKDELPRLLIELA